MTFLFCEAMVPVNGGGGWGGGGREVSRVH